MEPLDAAGNVENVRSSRGRRLSSILKAPRASGKLSDPDKVEHQVEVAKSVEKRISRRVSFAPASANNVLLFSKDPEHGSPVRTPLQTLSTTDNVDKRVQVGITDKEAQPVTEMETLLNAPLHAAQQRNKEMSWVHQDTQADYGERTVMFDSDDADYMDVTQSHTIIIANDLEPQAGLPELNFKSLPNSGRMDFTFSFGNTEAVTPRPVKISSSVHGLSPENILARADPPTKIMHNAAPSLQEDPTQDQIADPLPFLARLKALRSVGDKENQIPTSLTMMQKPQVKSRKSQISFDNSVFHPGNVVDGPTQMGIEVQNYTSNHDDMELTMNQTVGVESKSCRNAPSQNKSSRSGLSLAHVSPKMPSHNFDKAHHTLCQGSEREATMYNMPESDDMMDMTRSQTVAIDAKSLYMINTLQNKKRDCLNYMSASTLGSNVFGEESGEMVLQCQTRAAPSIVLKHANTEDTRHIVESDDMDITRSQTVAIDAKTVGAINLAAYQREEAQDITSEAAEMDMTRSQTVAIDAKTLHKVNATVLCQSEGTQKFTSEPDDMDMTRSQTVAIDAKTVHMVKATNLSQRDGTQNFTSEPDEMDMTRSQTVAIDAKTLHLVNATMLSQRDRTQNFISEPDEMDMTRCQTVAIDAKTLHMVDATMLCRRDGTQNITSEPDDMDMTRSQTVAIDAKPLHTVNPFHTKKRKSLAFMMPSQKTNNASNECGMEMTKALTVSIDHITQSSGSMMSDKHLNSLLPNKTNDMETLDLKRQKSGDMEFTLCQTSVIEANHFDVPLASVDIGRPVCTLASNENVFSKDFKAEHKLKVPQNTDSVADDMEITRSQTVAIDAESLYTAKPRLIQKQKGLTIRTAPHKDDNASVDMTKPLSVSSIEEKHFDAAKMSLRVCTGGSEITKDQRAYQTICQGEEESDDMDVTTTKTVDINTKALHVVSPFHIKKRKSLAFMTTSQPADSLFGMDMTKSLTVSIDHISQMSGSEKAQLDKPLYSSFPQTSHEMETLDKSKAESDTMEFTMCQTRVIEEKYLDTMSVGTRGLESNNQSLSEGEVIKNAFRNVCHLPQSNKTTVEEHRSVSINVEESKTDHTLNLDDMELTRSQTIAIGAENTRMVDSVELDTPRSSNPATESKYMCTAEETSKSANLDNPQTSAASEDLKRDGHSTPASDIATPLLNMQRDQLDAPMDANTKCLTHIQSKLRRISQNLNEANKRFTMDSCTAPTSQLDQALATNVTKATSLPVVEPDSEVAQTDGENSTPEKRAPVISPLNLKSKRLTSRLSMGCFVPKLPQRNKLSITTSDSHELNGNMLMQEQYGDIHDEVMPNCQSEEDLSESLEVEAPQATNENQQGCNIDIVLENDIFDDRVPIISQGKKRTLPEDYCKDSDEDDKRRRPLIDSHKEKQPLSVVYDSNLTASSSVITQPMDSSNSTNTTSLRCETTLESSIKQSMLESQLEDVTDWISNTHKKLDDGNITILEFFKCFNVDFVFYNSRQSVLPAKLAFDVDHKPEDQLRDLHINRPKQRVYEKDYQHLAEIMEGLKVRVKDQEGIVKTVNRPLWEAVRELSEKELKCFGAKLKEKSKLFRRRAKVQAHEMKEALYSNIHQAYLEEQQKLKGKVEAVDKMLKSLDDCISELQTELAAVEGKDLNATEPTLKSRQHGLERVTKETADNERQMYELEIKKKQNVDKLDRLRAETRDLQNSITTLDMLNEWKLKEKTESHEVYTFLHNTMYLEVVFEDCHGEYTDGCERNISDITLKLQLDDEKSLCHARLVHKLLSQYIEEEGNSWLKKYPTSHYVTALLHNVSLVVCRCRLLGEEVLLMKKWGAQRLNLLDISCVDTQVRLLFSSLKAFAKFELTIELTSGYPFCLPRVHNFRSTIGNTTIHQLEEIVFSITPARNYLTKIVKKINDTLLCGNGSQ